MKDNSARFKHFFTLITVVLWYSAISAQWSTDPWQNTPVNIQEYAQINPRACSDSKGGAIVLYSEKARDLYAQRIDKNGYILWDSCGVPICTAAGIQKPHKIISDGNGGAIMLWFDYREVTEPVPYSTPSNTIYIQKIDSLGNLLWESSGIQLSPFRVKNETIPYFKYQLPTSSEDVILDGVGGAYICWTLATDSLEDVGKTEASIQHVDAAGRPIWEEMGRPVKVIYSGCDIVEDGVGGVFFFVGHKDVIRYNPAGETVWQDTVKLSLGGGFTRFVSDDKGGFIGIGHIHNHGYPDELLFERRDENGIRIWGDIHLLTPADINSTKSILVFKDGRSGMLLSWMMNQSDDWNVYTQHLDSTGTILYLGSGVKSGINCTDNSGGWFDFGSERDSTYRIYAQQYSYEGIPQWEEKGALVKIRAEYWYGFGQWQFVSDLNNGVILIWDETYHMTQFYDIMAQLVNAYGQLGQVITAVEPEQPDFCPESFKLLPNYPNPFNGYTALPFIIHESGEYLLTIFSVDGTEVFRRCFSYRTPGKYEFIWDAADQNGHIVSSGVYICCFSDGTQKLYRKLLMIK